MPIKLWLRMFSRSAASMVSARLLMSGRIGTSGVALLSYRSLASLMEASRTVAMVVEPVVLMAEMALRFVGSVLLRSRPVIPCPDDGL